MFSDEAKTRDDLNEALTIGADDWKKAKKIEAGKMDFSGKYTAKLNNLLDEAYDEQGNEIQSIEQGQSGIMICDKTPFYSEGGGQVGWVRRVPAELPLRLPHLRRRHRAVRGAAQHVGVSRAGARPLRPPRPPRPPHR